MFYVYDDQNNKKEALDKEGVLALLEQAIEDGDLESIEEDSAFVSKLKDKTTGDTHYISLITQAQYNELRETGELVENCLYIISDDTSYDDIVEAVNLLIQGHNQNVDDIDEIKTTYQKRELLYESANGYKYGDTGWTLPENVSCIEIEWNFFGESLRHITRLKVDQTTTTRIECKLFDMYYELALDVRLYYSLLQINLTQQRDITVGKTFLVDLLNGTASEPQAASLAIYKIYKIIN